MDAPAFFTRENFTKESSGRILAGLLAGSSFGLADDFPDLCQVIVGMLQPQQKTPACIHNAGADPGAVGGFIVRGFRPQL